MNRFRFHLSDANIGTRLRCMLLGHQPGVIIVTGAYYRGGIPARRIDCRRCNAVLGHPKDELYNKLETLRAILSARPGESVVEAAKRWRETVEWYEDPKNRIPKWMDDPDEPTNRPVLDSPINLDMGQRARECLGQLGD